MPNATQNATTLGPKVAQFTHPVYTLLKESWQQLADVREGVGGFLTGEYLRAHPREWLDHTTLVTDAATGVTTARTNPNPKQPSPKLLMRRRIARYENVAGAILDAFKSVLFREQPIRRLGDGSSKNTKPKPIEAWWQDVDGKGTHIDDAVPQWWDLAGTFGHVGLYLHRDPGVGAETAADEPAPQVWVYTPLDILDWLVDEDGAVVSVKLMEAVPPKDFQTRVTTYRVRVVDAERITVYDYKSGQQQGESYEHGLGVMPFVFLFGKRRPLFADVGASILGDPRLYIDLFNLVSENRELLRNQTFSFINLPLGTGPDAMSVEQAQAMMGKQTGTFNVLFSAQPAQILSGEAANVTSYHDEIEAVRRGIYRETGAQWESDSKGVEARGSLEIKRDDMAARCAMFADECQQAEYRLVELFYRWTAGDTYEKAMADDQVSVQYPNRFDQKPFEALLAEAESAQAIGMPAAVLKELRLHLLGKFDGMADLAPARIEELQKAIEDAPDDMTPAEQLRTTLETAAQRTAGKMAGQETNPAAA